MGPTQLIDGVSYQSHAIVARWVPLEELGQIVLRSIAVYQLKISVLVNPSRKVGRSSHVPRRTLIT